MRALIVNQHTHNFGDDAAGDVLINLLLSAPEIDSVVIIYNGDEVPTADRRVSAPRGVRLRDIGLVNLARYLLAPRDSPLLPRSVALRRFRSLVREADAIIVSPSGANIGIYKDWRFLVRLMIVVREGGTPIFHWNTLGQSGNALFDLLARRVLRKSRIYVREQASRRYVEALGLECQVGPDTAFALAPIAGEVRRDVISLVPSELDSWHPEFRARPVNSVILGSIAQAIAEFAIEHGFQIDIVPHLRSASESSFNSAMKDALIHFGMASKAVQVRDLVETYKDYDQLLGTSRLVIGGRYHSVVLAGKNARPFVALSYENKMKEVCEYLGMAQYSVDLHRGQNAADELAACMSGAILNEVEISSSLRQVVNSKLAPQVSAPLRDLGLLGGR